MTEYARYNGIDYKFVTEDDGWVSIYEYDKYSNTYFPVIQAADMAHAHSYCVLREPIPVQFNIL